MATPKVRRRGPLVSLEYPGRLIALGTTGDGKRSLIVYAITGRSPSSQARKLVARDEGVWIQPTDEAALSQGRVDLLVYPALLFDKDGLAVSNGKQTADIKARLAEFDHPVSILSEALASWEYEPDAPAFTPRISGCVKGGRGALSVIRRGPDGASVKSFFEIPAVPGRSYLVSTYEGPNRDPLPSFRGEPREWVLESVSCREAAETVYGALGASAADRDFRVAVVSVFAAIDDPSSREIEIINRHERKGAIHG
jgi:IMP cyclohydrolase